MDSKWIVHLFENLEIHVLDFLSVIPSRNPEHRAGTIAYCFSLLMLGIMGGALRLDEEPRLELFRV